MDLRNCKKCNRMFLYEGEDLCSACRLEAQDDFKIVKEYLEENPGSSIPQVVEGTGVSVEKIMGYLKDDRLEIQREEEYILECESCGVKIPSGRFCNNCINKLKGDIQAVTKKDKDPNSRNANGNKFRIVDRYK